MFYGDSIGLDKVLAKMQDFQARFGDDFKPAKLLVDLAAQGKSFKDL
jgi:3-hydroxyacyl-CoA dehydrogenase